MNNPEGQPMLQVAGLTKSYDGRTVLHGVDLGIAPGQLVALLGPNGAGKTTLVSIATGLRRPDSGGVWIDGIDALVHSQRVRPLIGLAPQELGFYPTLRVRHNLAFFGRLAGLDRPELRERTLAVVEALGLTALMDRHAGDLSGGEKRRLHTALALLHRPRLLFLDEPTTGADVASRNSILGLVRDLVAGGCAVCYCTHYLPEVEALGGSVTILENGRVIASGDLEDIVAANGGAGVRLRFDGPPPDLAGWTRDGAELTTSAPDPAVTAARAITGMGAAADRLLAIDILHPTLETAYLALTGHRGTARTEQEETDDVATA
jgi:ABC-2 type transport system ATP-binding protein